MSCMLWKKFQLGVNSDAVHGHRRDISTQGMAVEEAEAPYGDTIMVSCNLHINALCVIFINKSASLLLPRATRVFHPVGLV